MELKPAILQQALDTLKNGGLIAFPTDTVYGLAGDANNSAAIDKIYQAKQRPLYQPLPVLLASVAQTSFWASHIPDTAWLLMEKFWPGPLTLLLPKATHVLDNLVAGQLNIALRVPNHPIALQLLAHTRGLAVTSANRSTHLSATTAQHVKEELGNAVDMIIDSGTCNLGLESTIIDLTLPRPTLTRSGALAAELIEEVIKTPLYKQEGVSSPYKINKVIELMARESLLEKIQTFLSAGKKIAVIAYHTPPKETNHLFWFTLSNQPNLYAQQLYPTLRNAMQLDVDRIFIEKVPEVAEWHAIKARLKRL